MNETELVHGLNRENNLGDLKASDILREGLILDEHRYQITTWQDLHQHVQEVRVLKCSVELDHPTAV